MEMFLFNTGEIRFSSDEEEGESLIREINVSFNEESYIFLEIDYNVLTIARLDNLDDMYSVTPFLPEDSGSCHKMYILTIDTLTRLTNEMFDVKKEL